MKVLLTRRRADGERTASRLKNAGFEPVLLPLFDLKPTNADRPAIKPDFVVVTSAAAVEAGGDVLHETISADTPIYCVGPRTHEALVEKAYKNIRQGEGSAEQLAERIKADLSSAIIAQAGSPLADKVGLYLCGRNRAFDFAKALENVPVDLHLWEVYDIEAIAPNRHALMKAFEALGRGIIMVFSPASASALGDLVEREGLMKAAINCQIVAISENCAAGLPAALASNVVVASAPNEAAMIEAAITLRGAGNA